MSVPRRIIRKLRTVRVLDVEDQLWPIVVVLLILAGFVAGFILARFSLTEPNWLYNGCTYLVTLSLTCGLLVWSAVHFKGYKLRRTMLFVLLTILVHWWIVMTLHQAHLHYTRPKDPKEDTERSPLVRITFDAQIFQQDTNQNLVEPEFQRPIETRSPEAEPEEIIRKTLQRDEAKPDTKPVDLQPQPKVDRVQPIKLPTPQQTAPKAGKTLAKMSRQNQQTNLTARATNIPQPAKSQRPATSNLQATATPAQRKTAEPAKAARTTADEPATLTEQPQAKLAQKQSRETRNPQASSSSPAVKKATPTPRPLPNAIALDVAPAQPVKKATADVADAAANTATRADTSPQVAKQQPTRQPTDVPSPTAAKARTPAATRRAAEPTTSPAVASSVAPSRAVAKAQSTATTASSSAAAAATPAPAPSSSKATPTLTPATSQVARNTPSQSTPQRTSPRASDSPTLTATRASARPAARRSSRPIPSPALSASSASKGAPAKTRRTAPRAASQVATTSLPSNTSPNRSAAQLSPSKMSVSRSMRGVVGAGRSQNMGSNFPTSHSPAPTPSTAARRPAPSQQGNPGPSLTPSRPAKVAKARSQAEVPSATLAVTEDAPSPGAVGSHNPAEIDASSSAAAERHDSSAALAKVTAASGDSQVDFGAVRTPEKADVGRSAGGGQPRVTPGSPTEMLARTRPGGSPETSVEAADVAIKPVSPSKASGGTSAAAVEDAAASATEVARADTGGASPSAARQTDQVGPQTVTAGTGRPSPQEIARADSEPAPPAVKAGDGTGRPTRAAGGSVAVETRAEQIAAVGNAGNVEGLATSLAANATKTAGRGDSAAPIKKVAADAGSGQLPTGPSNAVAKAIAGRASRDDSSPSATGTSAKSLARATRGQQPAAAALAVDAATTAPSGSAIASVSPAGGASTSAVDRADTGVVQVATNAEMGMGGLGLTPAPVPGSLSQRAQENSDVVIPVSARINTKRAGAEYVPDLRAQYVQPHFAGRKQGKQLGADYFRGQPTTKLEKAIGTGLEFLAKMQRPDGSWSLKHFPAGYENAGAGSIDSDTAATGLALLAFLGASYDQDSQRYGDVVRRGLELLIRNQKENGDLYIDRDKYSSESAHLYSHGIAAIALCEAYGMTTDVALLRDPAQKALDFIVAAQHAQRGGWRYEPGVESDTSVSGWQLMALKSGELSGLNVPKKTYEMVEVFLANAEDKSDRAKFVYNPYAKKRRNPNPTMTAVGLLMRLYLGADPKDSRMVRGAKHLMNSPPSLGTLRRPSRDTYYWYYATQVMAHMGDEHLRAWNEDLKPLLIQTQVTEGKFAGSWSPNLQDDGVVRDAWGKHGGRIYITAMNLLSLEVRHRLLPLYRDDTVARGK